MTEKVCKTTKTASFHLLSSKQLIFTLRCMKASRWIYFDGKRNLSQSLIVFNFERNFEFQYQGQSRCNPQVCFLYVYTLIPCCSEICVDELKLEVHQSVCEQPLEQQGGFKDSMTSILETLIPVHVVSRFNIASGCAGRGSACYYSWPIKERFWLGKKNRRGGLSFDSFCNQIKYTRENTSTVKSNLLSAAITFILYVW